MLRAACGTSPMAPGDVGDLTALGTFDRFRMRSGCRATPSPRGAQPVRAWRCRLCGCPTWGRPTRCGGAHRGDHP
jgi:hypothetical protein